MNVFNSCHIDTHQRNEMNLLAKPLLLRIQKQPLYFRYYNYIILNIIFLLFFLNFSFAYPLTNSLNFPFLSLKSKNILFPIIFFSLVHFLELLFLSNFFLLSILFSQTVFIVLLWPFVIRKKLFCLVHMSQQIHSESLHCIKNSL